jgi:hypothetical protein
LDRGLPASGALAQRKSNSNNAVLVALLERFGTSMVERPAERIY